MRHFQIFALLFATGCAHANVRSHASPFPDRWKITVLSIHAPKTDAAGKAWDADKSPPDIYGKLTVGHMSKEACSELVSQEIPRQKNTFDMVTSVSATLDNVVGQPPCFTLRLFDGDVLHDDPVGTVTAVAHQGEMVVTAGRAQARISVTGTVTEKSARR